MLCGYVAAEALQPKARPGTYRPLPVFAGFHAYPFVPCSCVYVHMFCLVSLYIYICIIYIYIYIYCILFWFKASTRLMPYRSVPHRSGDARGSATSGCGNY